MAEPAQTGCSATAVRGARATRSIDTPAKKLTHAADRVEHRGHGARLGHARVVSRQPRTLPAEDGG